MAGSQRPDNINSTAFRAALIDFIVGRLKEENKRLSTIQAFCPHGQLLPNRVLKRGTPAVRNADERQRGAVSILPARKDTNTDQYALPSGMANVRLSAIRACALGMRTRTTFT